MDINPEDETLYTTQYLEVSLKYVESEYNPRQEQLVVIKPERITSNNPFNAAMAL
jgi:hypothetical protein